MSSPQLQRGRRPGVGNAYSVTTVCRRHPNVLTSPDNVEALRTIIGNMEATGCIASLAWVAMPDQLHWLFQLRSGSLASCMQRLKGRSSLLINRNGPSVGPVWQPGYHGHAVRSPASLRLLALYLLANPVRAGLADRVGLYPHAWCRWSLEGACDER